MTAAPDGTGIEAMLTGGHPNSLGRTVEVVDLVLTGRAGLADLLDAYGSADPVVRLRVSSAVKRVTAVHPAWTAEHADRLVDEVERLGQPSAQWTLAQLAPDLAPLAGPAWRARVTGVLEGFLDSATDWIVLARTADTLATWARDDPDLADRVTPHLVRLAGDPRRSVSGRARKALALLGR